MPTKVFDAFTRLDASDVNAYLANKSISNAIINGGFDVWQRGTPISVAENSSVFTADRYRLATAANQASTVSRQGVGDTTNLPNIRFCLRLQRNSGQTGTGIINLDYCLERSDSIPYVGKSITVSYYARSGANYSPSGSGFGLEIIRGTGTDQNISTASGVLVLGTVTPGSGVNPALTTTWQRMSATVTVPADSAQIFLRFFYTPTGTAGASDYVEITGVQLEAGTVANDFRKNADSVAGELAACQRYFFRGGPGAQGMAVLSTLADMIITYPVPMRAAPSVSHVGNYNLLEVNVANRTATALASFNGGTLACNLGVTVGGGGMTPPNRVQISGATGANLDFNAEL